MNVETVQSLGSDVVHLRKAGSKFATFACNGRTVSFGFVAEAPVEKVSCKRCTKLVTL